MSMSRNAGPEAVPGMSLMSPATGTDMSLPVESSRHRRAKMPLRRGPVPGRGRTVSPCGRRPRNSLNFSSSAKLTRMAQAGRLPRMKPNNAQRRFGNTNTLCPYCGGRPPLKVLRRHRGAPPGSPPATAQRTYDSAEWPQRIRPGSLSWYVDQIDGNVEVSPAAGLCVP